MQDNTDINKKVENKDNDFDRINIDEIVKKVEQYDFCNDDEGIEIGDCFNENILSSVTYGIKGGKRLLIFHVTHVKR